MNKRLQGKIYGKGGHYTDVVDARDEWLYTWTSHHNMFKQITSFNQEDPVEIVWLMTIHHNMEQHCHTFKHGECTPYVLPGVLIQPRRLTQHWNAQSFVNDQQNSSVNTGSWNAITLVAVRFVHSPNTMKQGDRLGWWS